MASGHGLILFDRQLQTHNLTTITRIVAMRPTGANNLQRDEMLRQANETDGERIVQFSCRGEKSGDRFGLVQ